MYDTPKRTHHMISFTHITYSFWVPNDGLAIACFSRTVPPFVSEFLLLHAVYRCFLFELTYKLSPGMTLEAHSHRFVIDFDSEAQHRQFDDLRGLAAHLGHSGPGRRVRRVPANCLFNHGRSQYPLPYTARAPHANHSPISPLPVGPSTHNQYQPFLQTAKRRSTTRWCKPTTRCQCR